MKAVVEEGEIRITIDIDALAHAIENGLVVRVTNREALARWVADRITTEDDDVCPLAGLIEEHVAREIDDGGYDDMGVLVGDEEDEVDL